MLPLSSMIMYPLHRLNPSDPQYSLAMHETSLTGSPGSNSNFMLTEPITSFRVNLTIGTPSDASSLEPLIMGDQFFNYHILYYGTMAGLRLPDHSHCIFCGDPIPFGEEYCNEDCRRKEMERVASEKRRDNMFFVAAILTVVVIVAVGLII